MFIVKKNFLFIFILLFALPSFGFAHVMFKNSVPAANTITVGAPKIITLSFNNQIRLFQVTLQINDQESISLDIDKQQAFAKDFMLDNPSQQSGQYKIYWRGIGADGHLVKGQFSFTIE